MKKYKCVIYDIDGTLLNTLNMNMYPLIRIIKEEKNEDWTFEQVLKFVSYPGIKTLEELGIENVEKTYARWVKYVNEYEHGAKVYEGFETVFEKFDGKIIQAIVSSKMVAQYQIDVVEKGIDKYFKVAILADDTTKHKPDPEPIYKCLDKISIKPEEAIFIGDSINDYLAAKNAGVDFGYATWGSVSNDGIDDPTYVFNHPLDLLKLL